MKIFFFLFLIGYAAYRYVVRADQKGGRDVIDDLDEFTYNGRLLNSKDWERSKPPVDISELSLDVNDEYIALDDEDEEIIIDL